MGKVAIAAIAFGAGALAGGLFVRWYVQAHAGELAGNAIGAKLFGEGTTGAKLVEGLFGVADTVRS